MISGNIDIGGEVDPSLKSGLNGALPLSEVDAAYLQLAEIREEPVDAVTPYAGRGNNSNNTVVDPVAVAVIKAKETRAARALSSLRPGKRISRRSLEQAKSEKRDFRAGVKRTRKTAQRLGLSATAADREYRRRGTWRRGKAPVTQRPVRRLPKRLLAAEG